MIATLLWPLGVILAILVLEALTHRRVWRAIARLTFFVALLSNCRRFRKLHGGAWRRTHMGEWMMLTEDEARSYKGAKHRLEEWP